MFSFITWSRPSAAPVAPAAADETSAGLGVQGAEETVKKEACDLCNLVTSVVDLFRRPDSERRERERLRHRHSGFWDW